jgi:hypothetical protein
MRRNAFVMRKTVIGIHFPVRLPVEVWQAELRVAGRNHSISRWHLGDLLVHGEKADLRQNL